ncbi:MAG: hypothetical protein R2911_09480 [Caldilineaceae bacterium]
MPKFVSPAAPSTGYERTGGYSGLRKAVQEMTPQAVIEMISEQAGGPRWRRFPHRAQMAGRARRSGAPKTIVCNADEGEPGCFKDRAIMQYDPHAVIEGMILAAYATGATRGFIYLRYEYPEIQQLLENAIADAKAAGLLGQQILGADFNFELYVRRGAGAYICGEESSLLNSLEGKHPFPRNRPPFIDPRLRICPRRSAMWRRWPRPPKSCGAARPGICPWA